MCCPEDPCVERRQLPTLEFSVGSGEPITGCLFGAFLLAAFLHIPIQSVNQYQVSLFIKSFEIITLSVYLAGFKQTFQALGAKIPICHSLKEIKLYPIVAPGEQEFVLQKLLILIRNPGRQTLILMKPLKDKYN